MTKNRLESFSDGVIAILITIMVLELRPPASLEFEDISALIPNLLSYILSFAFLGVYWNNHHHLLHSAKKISGGVLWANMHLLFWLSLIPFGTAWLGNQGLHALPVATYGFILFCSASAYYILTHTLIRVNGPNSELAKAIGSDAKGKLSIFLYTLAIALAYFKPIVAVVILVGVALTWIVPDRRFEGGQQRSGP